MGRCKCRYCSANLTSDNAYRIVKNKRGTYFCNQEHYEKYVEQVEQKNAEKAKLVAQEKEEREKLKAKKKEEKTAEEQVQKEKRKADKDKVYWLICEIVGCKEIINTVLWKEWAIWNKVASNEVIGKYLEEHKNYLIKTIGGLENVEFIRIRYLSAILKNKLGDYKPMATEQKFFTPVIKDEHYETKFKPKQRQALLDFEEDCDE